MVEGLLLFPLFFLFLFFFFPLYVRKKGCLEYTKEPIRGFHPFYSHFFTSPLPFVFPFFFSPSRTIDGGAGGKAGTGEAEAV